LFKPDSVAGGSPQYSARLVFAKTHPAFKAMGDKLAQVATEKWGAKAKGILSELNATGRTCLRDGDTKASLTGFSGNWFVAANNAKRPGVVNADKTPLQEEDGVIYSGCYVNVGVRVWPQDNQYGKRLNAELLAVQYAGPGESWSVGGAMVSTDALFDDISGEFDDDEVSL